jgi:hypothetical protein
MNNDPDLLLHKIKLQVCNLGGVIDCNSHSKKWLKPQIVFLIFIEQYAFVFVENGSTTDPVQQQS